MDVVRKSQPEICHSLLKRRLTVHVDRSGSYTYPQGPYLFEPCFLASRILGLRHFSKVRYRAECTELRSFSTSERLLLSRGQVVYPGTPDNTAVVEGSRTSDVLLLLKTGLMMVTEVLSGMGE
jgi:hypothetical protein